MDEQKNLQDELTLENILAGALQLPGIKVNRTGFLSETFAKEDVNIHDIIDKGPIGAGCSEAVLTAAADKLILMRTGTSSAISFASGIPGGLAIAATIPADVIQFFGMALRIAQELSYIYGAEDFWENGKIDDDEVKGRLIIYSGVMYGVKGASEAVRIATYKNADLIPEDKLKLLTEMTGKSIGTKITKSTVSKGISKVIPVIGGVISGGMNFASMLPMAKRLNEVLKTAAFNYSDTAMNEDIYTLNHMDFTEEPEENTESIDTEKVKQTVSKGLKSAKKGLGNIFSSIKKAASDINTDSSTEKLKELASLRDSGVITQEEFEKKKEEILSRL